MFLGLFEMIFKSICKRFIASRRGKLILVKKGFLIPSITKG